MAIVVIRILLIAATIFIAVYALRYRLIKRPVVSDIFDEGQVDIDVAGIDYTHKIAEDTISTADRSADGILTARLRVNNQSNMATQYSVVASLKSGPPEVYERVSVSINDGQGTRWQGPITHLSETGAFQSVLPVGYSDDLSINIEQTDLNLRGAVDVEFDIYANPLGAETDPHKFYPREHMPRRWREYGDIHHDIQRKKT